MKFKFFGHQNSKSPEKKSNSAKIKMQIHDFRKEFPSDFIAAQQREKDVQREKEVKNHQDKCSFSDGVTVSDDMYVARFNVQTVSLEKNGNFKIGDAVEHVCMLKSNKMEIIQYYLCNSASRVFRVNEVFFDVVQVYADEPEKILLGRKFEDSVLLSHPQKEVLTEWLHLLKEARTAAFFNNRFKPSNPDCSPGSPNQMETSFSSLYRKEPKSPSKMRSFAFLKKEQVLKYRCPNGEIQEVVVEKVCSETKTVNVSWTSDGSRFEVTSDLKNIIETNPWIVNNDFPTDVETYVLETSSI